MNLEPTTSYGPDAFRASAIPPLPTPERGKRERLGDELQPWGDYAHIDPLERLITDAIDIQDCEDEDAEFYKDKWWGWNHKQLSFISGKLGLKATFLAIPFIWILSVSLGIAILLSLGTVEIGKSLGIPDWLTIIAGGTVPMCWLFLSFYFVPPTTNWLMGTAIKTILKPFETNIQKKVDRSMADGMSEFNRVTGQVKFALGKGRYFKAPFVEFDTYVERVVQRGGIFYRLMFVHRYTGKTFNNTWFSGVEADKGDVLALWDMLQRFMDVDQPIPDMPRFEPFRHLDPVTAECDRKSNRPARYWRDLNLEAWKRNEGDKLAKAKAKYRWGERHCTLTPKLGQIEMVAYRAKRPETAVPI